MKIYKHTISDERFGELVGLIRTGKYAEIGEELVAKELKKYLTNHSKLIEELDKKKVLDGIVKDVKKSLYQGVGVFAKASKKEGHHSTRIRDYSVYERIFSHTGKVKHIVDLGCGLNPLQYDEIGFDVVYDAIDINCKQIDEVKKYFSDKGVKGEVVCRDVLSMDSFPKADMYFLFAFLDSVEQVGHHKISEKIISSIDAKWIVVSFPTVTLSGNPMRYPKRGWFERMIERLGFDFEVFVTENEIFYVVKK